MKISCQNRAVAAQAKEVIRSLRAIDGEIEKTIFPNRRLDSANEQPYRERDTSIDGHGFHD